MFTVGVMTHGLFSPQRQPQLNDDDVQTYGIDWADWDDPTLRTHHLEQNLLDSEEDMEWYNINMADEVVIPEAPQPFGLQQAEELRAHLEALHGNYQLLQNMDDHIIISRFGPLH